VARADRAAGRRDRAAATVAARRCRRRRGARHATCRLAGTAAGLAAGLTAAVNPLVVEYSVEARSYGLALLAVSVTALGLARWLDDGRLLLYAVGAAAAGLAHWYTLPVLAGYALAATVLRRRRAVPLLAVTSAASLPALGLVGLAQLNGVGSSGAGWIQHTGWAVPVRALQAWTGGSTVLLALTLAATVVGLLRTRRPAVVAGCWVLVPLAAVTAADLVRPVFVPRYLLPAMLGLAVLAAVGAVSWRRPVPALAVAGLVAASLLASAPLAERGPREDGRAAATYVATVRAPGEQVAAADQRAALALVHYGDQALRTVLVLPPDDPRAAERVWLVRQASGGTVRPGDDDVVLATAGLQVQEERLFPGTNTDLVVQRWDR
jgi:mannosyltransferase